MYATRLEQLRLALLSGRELTEKDRLDILSLVKAEQFNWQVKQKEWNAIIFAEIGRRGISEGGKIKQQIDRGQLPPLNLCVEGLKSTTTRGKI